MILKQVLNVYINILAIVFLFYSSAVLLYSQFIEINIQSYGSNM